MKDLATVMILQRRLNSIQRDLGPLEDKVHPLMSGYKFSLPFFMHFLQIANNLTLMTLPQ